MGLLILLIHAYSIVVIVSVLLSWLRLPPENPAVGFVNVAVEPVLAPIRKMLPAMGGLDFSPWVLIIGLRVLAMLLGG